VKLFDQLSPDTLKESIVAEYDKLSKSKLAHPESIELHFLRNGTRITCGSRSEDSDEPTSLLEVLEHCGNGLETWRYVYESLKDKHVAVHKFPFRRLNVIAEVLYSVQTRRTIEHPNRETRYPKK
jgi:hypothetical protein